MDNNETITTTDIIESRRNSLREVKMYNQKQKEIEEKKEAEQIKMCINLINKIFVSSDKDTLAKKGEVDFSVWKVILIFNIQKEEELRVMVNIPYNSYQGTKSTFLQDAPLLLGAMIRLEEFVLKSHNINLLNVFKGIVSYFKVNNEFKVIEAYKKGEFELQIELNEAVFEKVEN